MKKIELKELMIDCIEELQNDYHIEQMQYHINNNLDAILKFQDYSKEDMITILVYLIDKKDIHSLRRIVGAKIDANTLHDIFNILCEIHEEKDGILPAFLIDKKTLDLYNKYDNLRLKKYDSFKNYYSYVSFMNSLSNFGLMKLEIIDSRLNEISSLHSYLDNVHLRTICLELYDNFGLNLKVFETHFKVN